MARYTFDAALEAYFISACTNACSLGQAALQLIMNYKTVRFHAKRLGCFKTNQPGKNRRKPYNGDVIALKEILSGSHPTYQSHKLKRRLVREGYKSHQCETCFLTEWGGVPIPLELHHVDGNRYNNTLQNVRLLCPNCHALTDNHRARNIRNLSAPRETGEAEPLKFGEA